MTFTECQEKGLSHLENNTTLIRIDDDTFGILLHSTIIIKIHRDGSYTLYSGGFRTKLTAQRLNQYLPKRIISKKKKWYVDNLPFQEGMKI